MIDFDRDTAFHDRVLDALSARASASLKNIAAQNVPGYKRIEVRFEDRLRQALADGRDLGDVRPEVVRDTSGEPGQNNVSLLDEMTLLDKTRLVHDLMTRRAGSYFAQINRAIFGR